MSGSSRGAVDEVVFTPEPLSWRSLHWFIRVPRSGDERIRVEAFAGRFPLTSLGEGVVSMVIPLALSIAGFLVGIVCVQHRVGRWGALSSALGLFAAWIILGPAPHPWPLCPRYAPPPSLTQALAKPGFTQVCGRG